MSSRGGPAEHCAPRTQQSHGQSREQQDGHLSCPLLLEVAPCRAGDVDGVVSTHGCGTRPLCTATARGTRRISVSIVFRLHGNPPSCRKVRVVAFRGSCNPWPTTYCQDPVRGSVRGPQAASAEPSGAEGGTPGPHRPRPYPDTLRGENTSSCTFFLKPSRPPFPSEIGEVEPGQDAFRTSNSHLSESPGHEEGPSVLPAGTAEKGRKQVKTGKKPGACRRVGE